MIVSRHRSQGIEMDSPSLLGMETPDFKPRMLCTAVGTAGLLGWQRQDPPERACSLGLRKRKLLQIGDNLLHHLAPPGRPELRVWKVQALLQ